MAPPARKSSSARKAANRKVAYFNRETSWLAFNRRVLEQAQDDRFPLLERLRFMSFVSSNLDEFYEIRVAGLMQQVDSGVVEEDIAGLGPKEQLRRIHNITASLVDDQYRTWREQLVPALAKEGLQFKAPREWTKAELKWMKRYFEEQVLPVLTPMAIDPSHPFPQIGNKTLNMLFWLDNPNTDEVEKIMAIIPVPRILPRIVAVGNHGDGKGAYIFLSDLIKFYGARLFPGYKVMPSHAFRITRNSDLYIDDEEVENLLKTIEEELYNRRKGAAVRLEIEEGVEDELLDLLLEKIHLTRDNVFTINGPINLMRLQTACSIIARPDLKFPPFAPYHPPTLRENIFAALRQRDHLLHHPYDSFQPVVDLIEQAARDPDVLAIKLTLYRTSSDSAIVRALAEAARNDKQVTALVELKARFDEENNIQWARMLEEAGAHVVYGLVGLKTHCKCLLVVRREGNGIKRYAHLGTGNYHPNTARLYTDISMLTARDDLTYEVSEVFNALTGFALSPQFDKLLVAPFTLHARMQERIQREAANARKGKPARIFAKTNSLVDKQTIDNLYKASQAGVKIDLVVRGICNLVPNLPGLSENITVKSILGRYLEHSRIFSFANAGGEPEIFLGSADWMPRNFFRRIEVVFPVENPDLRQRLIDDIIPAFLKENAFGKFLRANGAYYRVPRKKDDEEFSCQDYFMRQAEQQRQRLEANPAAAAAADRPRLVPARAPAPPASEAESIPPPPGEPERLPDPDAKDSSGLH